MVNSLQQYVDCSEVTDTVFTVLVSTLGGKMSNIPEKIHLNIGANCNQRFDRKSWTSQGFYLIRFEYIDRS